MTQPEIDQLIVDHMDLVRELARCAAKRLPASVLLDDLVSAGNLGLVEAANKYNPELHPRFAAYARFRVWGAIIDSVRYYRWPRRYESIPENWLQGGLLDNEDNWHAHDVPPELIDPQPLPDAAAIQQQEENRTVISITAARRRLSATEGNALDASLNGSSMRQVGRRAGKSGAWAHYVVKGAKRKLRTALIEIERDRAA